jgi:hypothetical protein
MFFMERAVFKNENPIHQDRQAPQQPGLSHRHLTC